jgi:ABC-2 type transport system permease protein
VQNHPRDQSSVDPLSVKQPQVHSLGANPGKSAGVRTYLVLAAAEFRRYSTYRLAIFAGVVTQSVFGFIRMGVLFAAIAAAGGTLAGYDQLSASTYVWLGQALLAPIAIFGWIEIAERVSSGEIAVDFSRPADLQLAWWARDLGRACFQLLARGLPPLVIGAVTVGIALPQSWTAYPLGLVSLILAVSISFTVRFLVNMIAFWTLDVRGFVGLYIVVAGPLCGLFIPVHVFPEWLRILAYATPFPSMLQSPIDVLSGYVLDAAAAAVVATQFAWLAGLVGLARVVQWRAGRRLVVQGG